MTVGKLLELLGAKAGALSGSFKYGTAFSGNKMEELSDILVSYGFSYSGKFNWLKFKGKDCLISG
jgi:DNA-directed RNA polymerase III subunit RPC2